MESNILVEEQLPETSSLSDHWSSFYGKFRDQVVSKSDSSGSIELNGSMLLCAGGSLSLAVLNTVESYGCDFSTLENILELVEEKCLLNLIICFDRFRCYRNQKCKVEVSEAFGKAWSDLSEFGQSSENEETFAVVKEETAESLLQQIESGIQRKEDQSEPAAPSEQKAESRKSLDHPIMFHCHMCYKPFQRLRTLQLHKQKKHSLETVADYCCQLCGHEFYMLSTLKSHIHRKHFAQRHSLCLYCGKYFEDPADCRRHRLQHMGERRKIKKTKGAEEAKRLKAKVERVEQQAFQCQLCFWKFSVLESLQNHIFRKHYDEKDCICRYCGKHFKNSEECRKHVREHLVERKKCPEYKCGLCPAKFQLHYGLESHIVAVHSTEKDNMCAECGKHFESIEESCQHVRKKFNLQDSQDEDDEPIDIHPEEQELQENDVEVPGSNENSPVNYHCEMCDGNFETLSRLQNHIFRRHHDERNQLCRYCGKKFEDIDECSNHVRAHIVENRKARRFHQQTSTSLPIHSHYRCQLCGATFQLDSAFRSHRLREHYAEKDRLCPSCGKCFNSAEECKMHKRIHFERRILGSKGKVSGFTNCSCQLCGKEFKLLGSLETHLQRKHPSDRYFLCRYCGKHFSTAQERKVHVRLHVIQKREFSKSVKRESTDHPLLASGQSTLDSAADCSQGNPLKLVKCCVCGLEYQLAASLRRHIQRKHRNVKERVCQICAILFDDVASCRLHMHTEHSQNKFFHEIIVSDPETQNSQIIQVKEEGLEPHQSNGDGLDPQTGLIAKPKPWKCGLCGSLFNSRRNMRDHIRILHSKEKEQMCYCCGRYFEDPSECLKHKQEDLVCEYCPKEFKTKFAKDNHVRRHVSQRNFQCHICGNFYYDKKGLNAHYLRHRNAMEQAHQCSECGKVLSSKETLKYHMRIHRNERPFVCDICGKAFTQKVTWQNHKDIHAGIKPFECEICGKRTRSKADMARHMPLHSDKKEFVCDVCGKAYRFPSGLQQHRSLHTGHRPHICKICGCTYRHSSELKKHLKTHRPGAKTRNTTVPKVPVSVSEDTNITNNNSSAPTEIIMTNYDHNNIQVLLPPPENQNNLPPATTLMAEIMDPTYTTLTSHPNPTLPVEQTDVTIVAHHTDSSAFIDNTARLVARAGTNAYTNDEMAVVVALQVLDEIVVEQNV